MKKFWCILGCILCMFSACGGTGDATHSGSTDSSSTGGVVTICFQQSGQTEIVKTVEKGQALTDVPVPVAKTGYTIVWSVTDFSAITEDIVVTAVEEAKTYSVTLKNGNKETVVSVKYNAPYAFDEPTNEDYVFAGWQYGENTVLPTTGIWKIDADDIVLVVKWGGKSHTGNY